MNFGKGILIAFVLFASLMATLVYVCVKQDVNLVTKNYYQEELKHQGKMDRIQNANELVHQPTISFQAGSLQVVYPEFSKIEEGQLKLVRPSDPSLDANFNLTSTEETQNFKLEVWQKGLYRVSMRWKMDGKEFYVEKVMVL
jgi:Uncharacterized protein conserved in bacteria